MAQLVPPRSGLGLPAVHEALEEEAEFLLFVPVSPGLSTEPGTEEKLMVKRTKLNNPFHSCRALQFLKGLRIHGVIESL